MALNKQTNKPTNEQTNEQTNRLWLVSWFVCLLIGLIVGALGGWVVGQVGQPRGVVYGVPPKVELAQHAFGVNVDLNQLPSNFFEQAQPIGARWLRQTISWRDSEVTAGRYIWKFDLDRAKQHNYHILLLLRETPDWARDAQTTPSAPPKDARAFGAFARAVAERYKGMADAYQVWDEPNLAAGWGGQEPNPIDYARLLREAAINIHAVDPNAIIVSAALAPTTENGPLNINEPEFLRQLYRVGARDSFDVLGAEPFGFWTGPDDRRVDVNALNFSRLILLREIMQANGDGNKAIWATSFGWFVKGDGDSPFGGDTAEKQTARTLDAIRRARDEWPWLGPLMFARWQPEGANDPRSGFALLQADGSQSLLLQSLTQTNSVDTRVLTIGRHAPDDPHVRYPQSWRVTHEAADAPKDESGSLDHATPLTLRFRGTRFDLSVRRGFFEGFLFVTVDGQPANALPRDEQGRSYVVLFDPLGQTADVTLARGLGDGEHVVELAPQGGWGQWALAGFVVARERDDVTAWPFVGAVIGVLLSLVAYRVSRIANRPAHHASRITHHASRITLHISRISPAAIFLAGALLYFSPTVAASWLLIALLALLIFVRLDAGLALVAFAIPFYLQPKALGVGSYAVVEIVVLLCA
ncbi:MAG: hypothetical protein ABI874_04210, partial [Chloroflexota bacterium]